MILDVYLYGRLTGYLYTKGTRGLCFRYDSNARRAVSLSLPLKEEEYGRREAEPFFSGLLPDGNLREELAKNAHVSSESVIKLLEHYGREIAGAVVILDHDEKYSADNGAGYRLLGENEIENRIRDMDDINLFLWGDNVRLSLAGAQNKVPLYFEKGKWFLPLGDSPSNCIVKPGKSVALNERVVTEIASLCGFDVPRVELVEFGKFSALVSYRYDRILREGKLERLHQEDMCQALAVPPGKKYESDGGPSVTQIISLIRKESSFPAADLREFLRILVFNYIVGNCDSHAKNYSFLYGADGGLRLAPFYDLLSTTVYPGLSRELSMKIGKQRIIDNVLRKDFMEIDGISPGYMLSVISYISEKFVKAVKILNESYDGELSEMLDRIWKDSLIRLKRLET